MKITFPVLKKQKFQIGDIVHYKSKEHYGDDEFVGIVTYSYAQKFGGDDYKSFNLYIPKWLNPNIKKTAPGLPVPNEFAWAMPSELTFIRNLEEEEAVKFLAEYYRIIITK